MSMIRYSHLGVSLSKEKYLSSASTIFISESIGFSIFSKSTGYIITDSGDLHQISLPSLNKTFLSTSVKQISCNSTAMAFVTQTGFLLAMGEDPSKFGILGIKGQYSIKSPRKIELNIKALSVSLGEKHAGLVTCDGELYTWGTGYYGELGFQSYNEKQLPSKVQCARIFLVREVLCSRNFTMICTSGGFLYIFGQLQTCPDSIQKKRSPYSIKSLEKHFISKIDSCEDFVVVMMDKGDLYIVDDCLEPVKLPERYVKTACSDNALYCLSKNDKLLHEFRSIGKNACRVKGFNENVYFFEDDVVSKINVFSGYYFSFEFSTFKNLSEAMALKFVAQNRITIEMERMKVRKMTLPQCSLKFEPVFESIYQILYKCQGKILKNSFENFKQKCRYRNYAEKESKKYVLTTVLHKILLKKIFLYKRHGMKMINSYLQLKKSQKNIIIIESAKNIGMILTKLLEKNLNLLFRYSETYKAQSLIKLHAGEILWKVLYTKTMENYFAGLHKMKDKARVIGKCCRHFSNMVKAVEKYWKDKFLKALLNRNMVMIKLGQIFNSTFAFSNKKNARSLMIKGFSTWKRQIVTSKIVAISMKYTKSIKLKKLAHKLNTLLHNSYKKAFTSLKITTKPNTTKYRLMFFVTTLSLHTKSLLKFSLSQIKQSSFSNKHFTSILQKLLYSKLHCFYYLISDYIKKRKMYYLISIITKSETRLSKEQHKKLYQMFYRLKNICKKLRPLIIPNQETVTKEVVNKPKAKPLLINIKVLPLSPKSSCKTTTSRCWTHVKDPNAAQTGKSSKKITPLSINTSRSSASSRQQNPQLAKTLKKPLVTSPKSAKIIKKQGSFLTNPNANPQESYFPLKDIEDLSYITKKNDSSYFGSISDTWDSQPSFTSSPKNLELLSRSPVFPIKSEENPHLLLEPTCATYNWTEKNAWERQVFTLGCAILDNILKKFIKNYISLLIT